MSLSKFRSKLSALIAVIVVAAVFGLTIVVQNQISDSKRNVALAKPQEVTLKNADPKLENAETNKDFDGEKPEAEVYKPEVKPDSKTIKSTIIIKPAPGVTSSMIMSKLAEIEKKLGTIIVDQGKDEVYSYDVDPFFSDQILDLLNRSKLIITAENDAEIETLGANYNSLPNDPAYVNSEINQWNDHKSYFALKSYPGGRFDEVWDQLDSAEGTAKTAPIAVIDSGFNTNLLDKGVNIISGGGMDVNNPQNSEPNFNCQAINSRVNVSHGTFVASQISANTNNNYLSVGAAWDNEIVVYNAQNPATASNPCQMTLSNIILNIQRAIQAGVKVINFSIGLAAPADPNSTPYPALKAAIEAADKAGIVMIAASGNTSDNTKYYPASYEEVISVGAVDRFGSIAPYSTFNEGVNIAAPGGVSGDLEITSLAANSEAVVVNRGTSMATAFVSAAAALTWRFNPKLSSDQIREILLSSANDMPLGAQESTYCSTWNQLYDNCQNAYRFHCLTMDKSQCYGSGILDVFEAVNLAKVEQPKPPKCQPNCSNTTPIPSAAPTTGTPGATPAPPKDLQLSLDSKNTIEASWEIPYDPNTKLYKLNFENSQKTAKNLGISPSGDFTVPVNKSGKYQQSFKNIQIGEYTLKISSVNNQNKELLIYEKSISSEVIATGKGNAFKDLKNKVNSERAADINWLAKSQIALGVDCDAKGAGKNCKFQPNSAVNRGAMAQFMHKLVGSPEIIRDIPKITDISKLSKSRVISVQWLASQGITKPSKSKYLPKNSVNRGAMAEFLYRLAGSPGAIELGHSTLSHNDPNTLKEEAKLYKNDSAMKKLKKSMPNRYYNILWLAKMKITVTKGKYNPSSPVNRGAMAQFLHRFYDVILVPVK